MLSEHSSVNIENLDLETYMSLMPQDKTIRFGFQKKRVGGINLEIDEDVIIAEADELKLKRKKERKRVNKTTSDNIRSSFADDDSST